MLTYTMYTLPLLLLLGLLIASLLMNVSSAIGVKDGHMFVYHDKVIVKSSTTVDRNAKTRLVCASLCMQNEDCVALSYQDKTCRLETSGNLSVIRTVGAVTMTYHKGLTLQQDITVTNSPTNNTTVIRQDGTTQSWPFTSTNNQSVLSSETITSVDVSIEQTWSNTSPPAETTTARNHSTTDFLSAISLTHNYVTSKTSASVTTRDTRSMGTTTVRDVIEDQSSTEATTDGYVTSYKSSMESTTHDFVTTVTSTKTINTSPADISTRNDGTTDATTRGRVTTNGITTSTITATSSMGTPENKYQTTDQEPVSSTSQPDTTTNVNSWPSASNYVFVNIDSTMIEAKIGCNSIGGKLLEIENVTKEQFLRDNNILNEAEGNMVPIKMNGGDGVYSFATVFLAMSFFWIGAFDGNGDGNYEWLSNPTVPMAYTNWNNQEPRRTGTNLCLYSSNNWDLRWGSTPCTDLYRFFCEKLS